ncbi:diguanylate cyclase domain-containing protein [Mycobacterium sp. IDR2000157661]|uniref:diguanylate cyclase domain-containing protein n=1 Tax=Mycobacterium sp. IDR2000157661 TaxID=2867005 RepID=UPI001EECC9CB|nr:diguanylate cyclase [Mycobacterium sp. IDR2000157661]
MLVAVAAVYTGVLAVLAAWLWQTWGGPEVTRRADDVLTVVGVLFAAGCSIWAAHRAVGRVRRGWTAMAVGLLAWAVGEVIWVAYELVLGYEQTPVPSWADVAYLLFYVGAVAAVLLLSASDQGQSQIRLVLDGIIVAASVFLIAWVTVLQPVYESSSESAVTQAVSLAYPVADVVVITIAWARAAAAYRQSLGLLIAGLIVVAIADSVYSVMLATGTYTSGSLIDLGWIAGCGFIGLAALRSVGERPIDGTLRLISSQLRVWGPYIPLVLACGIGIAHAIPMLTPAPFAAAGVLVVVGVLIRQFIVLLENRRLLAKVTRLAFRDPLTGLANRALFLDRVEQAVAHQGRKHDSIAVLCMDLDDFKTVNDELGHPAGDELLIRVAQRLSSCLRTTDTIARFGGDEFAVLITGNPEDARVTGERILDSFADPIAIDGVNLTIRPSVGLTVATPQTPPATVDDLIRNADLAMYAAKRNGGGCLRIFVPDSPDPFDLPTATDRPAAQGVSIRPKGVTRPMPRRSVEPRLRTPTWAPVDVRIGLSALLAGVVAFAVVRSIRGAGDLSVVERWWEAVLYLSASMLVAARAYRVRAERAAWWCMAAGMALTGWGNLVTTLWDTGHPSPSPADPLFLASYPALYAGLVLLVRSRLRSASGLVRLDAVIAAMTSAAVSAAVLAPYIHAAEAVSLAGLLITTIYLVAGVLVLSMASGLVAMLGWRAEPRWFVLLGGLILWVIANSILLLESASGEYVRGTWLDATWPISFLLVAVACWLRPSPPTTIQEGVLQAQLWPPIVSTAIALGVALTSPGERLAVTLSAVTLTAIVARLAVTFRGSGTSSVGADAMTDELTGLTNRRGLTTALTADPPDDSVSSSLDGSSARVALLLLDINEFDEINEAFAHAVGNELLRCVAARLSRAVRPADLVIRSGGDEFAILLTQDVNLLTARTQAGALMDALRPPFALDHLTVQIDVSIAIAMWPEHCAHPQELLSRAEAALPQARTTEGRIAFYDAELDLRRGNEDQLVEDLRQALGADESGLYAEAGQLICHYQPKITDEGWVHSVEALVRWQHPTRGLLLPDQFLAAAERAGLMRPVAARVLDVALAQTRAWCDRGIDLTVAVNLSATNLLDIGLVETIDGLLTEYRLPASALIVEITEGTLAPDSRRSRNTVAALRRLGIRISLDDYGTGWSSLARLQDLSVDELKLDKVFAARLSRDPRSVAIVRSTVALAHSLGADLVAEGVEDAATLEALRRFGCSITQGHVHSPPLPPDELYDWLMDRSPELAH